MISEDELSHHCYARTLQRARQIASSDKSILTKQCHYNGFETTLSALVASSRGWSDHYRTSVTLDEDNDLIIDFSCTCPAYREYDGLCKHGAALVLTYNASPEKFIGYQRRRTATTSACITDFMNRNERTTYIEDHAIIDLETTIVYGYRTWSTRFKIKGPHGSYVMKSISDFITRMRTGAPYSYGKKLTFTHSFDILTDHARAVAQFLDRAVSLRAHVNGSMLWRSRSQNEVGRDLDLSDFELIELLDLHDHRTFTVEGIDYGTRSTTQAHIVDTDPSIDIRLCKTDRGGYDIARTNEIVFAAQGDRMYVWQDDIFYRCSSDFARCADFLRNVYDGGDDRLFISEADMPLFCATVMPTIEDHLHVHAPSEIEAYRPVPCQLEFYFDKTERSVLCDAQAVYGQQRHTVLDGDPEGTISSPAAHTSGPLRDKRAETMAKQLVERYFEQPASGESPLKDNHVACIDIDDHENIAHLIFGGLLDFQALGTVFTTPAFDRLTADHKPHMSMGLSIVGNLINLSVSSDDLPADELGALLLSYRRHKRYHRLRSGAFINMMDYDLSQLDRIAADLNISSKQLASGTVELPSYRAFYLDQELDDADGDGSFARYIESFHSVDEQAYRIPESLVGTLRPYQVEGFRWLNTLCDMGFSGILADEMGLGKSIQLISLLLARRDEAREVGPSLITCPASLVYNWIAEFERFAPELEVRAVAGTKRERTSIRNERNCDVMVTSYDLLRIDADSYAEQSFFCHALDEAQYIKNHAALTTRSVKRVQSQHRLALTGTPMENRLSELWSIFDFLMPGLLGSYMHFREHYELSILGGDQDVARRLQAIVEPFMLRRLKIDVLRDLPEKLESVVYAQMGDEQRRLYAGHEQKLRMSLADQKSRQFNERKVEILAELTKLRQLCCDPHLLYENYTGNSAKLETIMAMVESAMSADAKILVFSQFTSFLSLIAKQLDKRAISYFTITGATPKKKRLNMVNTFNADDTPVFLVSLKAGGTGLNLIGASMVIHADPWWNIAAQNQATDRAHRIGQTQVVSVYRVIAKGTVEERILALQEAKSDLVDQIIGSSSVSLASLSKDDLVALLQA